MQVKFGVRTFGSLAVAAVLVLPAAGFSQAAKPSAAQSAGKLSDAQVEANVLKAFAADGRLANQPINTSTVFGSVTLSGSVTDEGARDAAEQIASRTDGVKKVVDQLTVGGTATATADPAGSNMLPADGSALPASRGAAMAAAAPQGDPNSGYVPQGQAPAPQGQYGPGQDGYPPRQQPYGQGGYPQGMPQGSGAPEYAQGQSQPQSPQGQYPQDQYSQEQGAPQYGDDPSAYPPQGGPPPPPRRMYYRQYQQQMAQRGQQGYMQQPQGQPGGVPVTIPAGIDLPVRINRWISSGDAAPGSTFDAFVTSDILAGGQIAIPRGATVQGTVVDAKGAGVLKGRGQLSLQLTALNLGGQHVPLQSDIFAVNGHDKAAQSVNSTIIGAGVGALLGAAIGRGTGAAIGAGVGGAAGLGTSAASGGGNANLPAEALLHFRLAAPVQVTTVSEAEMQRLGGYAGPASAYSQPEPYGRPYPAVRVGVYASPYPYRYYRRGYYGGPFWY